LLGWYRRRQSGFVPCTMAGCDQLLYVPLEDFYESYRFFCEYPGFRDEIAYFLSRLRDTEVFYDIGAFRGAFSTITKMKLQQKVAIHVFEPLPKKVEAIQRICQRNHFEDFKINPLAVGNGRALAGAVNQQDFMFRPGEVHAAAAKTAFPAITLDKYIQLGAAAPTVIKIDVEGFELEVLRGAQQCLSRNRPRLWLEVHPSFLKPQNESADDVLAFLGQIGYATSFFNDYNPKLETSNYHVWCE
jgi:FkbM family methyltransferase